MSLNSAIVIASEFAMALYPILVKLVPTDLNTQVFARVATYSTLAYLFAESKDVESTWLTGAGSATSMSLGLLTLFHIASSYVAFKELPAGTAMSLFYTYPVWNLVIAAFLHGEVVSVAHGLLVLTAFVGVYLITQSTADPEQKSYDWLGVLAALGAALSESAIYFSIKHGKHTSVFKNLLELYPGALILLAGYLLVRGETIDMRTEVWTPLLLFNIFVGFIGFCLWSYSITRVSTLTFSLLSFFGVIASFTWGWLFVGEVPKAQALVGATMIVGSTGLSYWI